MCRSRKLYRFTIERQVIGTKQFAIVKTSHFKKTEEITMPRVEIQFLTQLCNNNKDTPIKFGIVTDSGKEINAIQTTVNKLLAGTRQFKGKSGATLTFLEFSVENRPTFINY